MRKKTSKPKASKVIFWTIKKPLIPPPTLTATEFRLLLAIVVKMTAELTPMSGARRRKSAARLNLRLKRSRLHPMGWISADGWRGIFVFYYISRRSELASRAAADGVLFASIKELVYGKYKLRGGPSGWFIAPDKIKIV